MTVAAYDPLLTAQRHSLHLGAHMSPELETLDQLCGGDLTIPLIRQLFSSGNHFVRAIMAMLRAGDVRLVDPSGCEVPHCRWREILTANSTEMRLSITEAGERRML